ncbi:MAG: transcriptional regulator [Lachnospiraceae bacterium]|nr:transcriptional regulator [Lachnospiraceae bacterium]
MSLRNAGLVIREARLKAGLTQEQLSDGICRLKSLSKIETGVLGVSPSTFEALMERAGSNTKASPIFANRTDFNCFYSLKRVHFFWDYWQLRSAYDELEKIEKMNWANNKYYYQEWLLLHCKIQLRSGCGSHRQNYDTITDAISISIPDFHYDEINKMLLSVTEIELFIALAHEAFYINELDICVDICSQISTYLTNSALSFYEKEQLLAENAIVYSKYLLAIKDFNAAYKMADTFRHKAIFNMNNSVLHELSFLTALGLYYNGDIKNAYELFESTIYSTHSTGSCYATICTNYIKTLHNIKVSDDLINLPIIPLEAFDFKSFYIVLEDLGDGSYDLTSPDTLSLGGLIRELRIEQKLSQTILCYGLCSKSKLSKIENNILQPEIALAEALLQRLGINDNAFTFLGNKHESELDRFKKTIVGKKLSEKQFIFEHIRAMEHLLTPKDTLFRQYTLFKKACYIDNAKEKSKCLRDALSLTLPDFDINKICSYRLSWLELTILNNLSLSCFKSTSPSISIQYFYKILEYLDTNNIDIFFKEKISAITITMLINRLYAQKRYSEIVEMPNLLSFSTTRITSDIYSLANAYAHFCQALGECGHIDEMLLFAHYSFGCYKLYENTETANLLYSFIKEDFNIDLT